MTALGLREALDDLAIDNRYAEVDEDAGPLLAWCDALGEPLEQLLHREAKRLDTSELRVAASLVQYGVAERLWAVRLGLWARHDRVLEDDALAIPAATPRWRFALSERARGPLAQPAEELGIQVGTQVVEQLTQLHEAIRTHCRVAEGVLWGNAATGLVMQTRHHAQGGTARAARRMIAVRDALLARSPMGGLVSGVVAAVGECGYQRRSCCLYYRAPAGGPCGDCPLEDSVAVRERSAVGP